MTDVAGNYHLGNELTATASIKLQIMNQSAVGIDVSGFAPAGASSRAGAATDT